MTTLGHCGGGRRKSTLIRSHIGFTQECGVVLKLDEFSYLIGSSFGFGSSIGLEYLSLVL